jgi:hypothetical protein
VHEDLLWAIHPRAEPHRQKMAEVFAGNGLSEEQKRTVLAFLGWQARGYLDRERAAQAEIIAEFARSLAEAGRLHEDREAFDSMASRARADLS